MTTDGGRMGAIVGVRLDYNGPVVFCHEDSDARTARPALMRGQRVRVDLGRGTAPREGVVAIVPEHIIAAPPLDGAPRVVAAIPLDGSETSTDANVKTGSQGKLIDAAGNAPDATFRPAGDADRARTTPFEGDADLTPVFLPADDADLTPVFLPADDADLTPADLAGALGLAALPLPEAPPQRERDGERQRQ